MGGRVGKLERGGIEKKENKREGGLDVKFDTYRGGGGHYFFIPFCKLEKY